MPGWIVTGVIFFLFFVVLSLYYFEKVDNRELRKRLKEIKGTDEYKLKERADGLERYVTQFLNKKKQDTVFAATFEKVGKDSIENSLHAMINRAEMEIIFLTPWIKRRIWERIKGRVLKFLKDGGELKVFIKGTKEDFSSGRSDWSVVKDIRKFGGVVTFVPKLHAKVYVVDRREALICSANLSRSGMDYSFEAGVWSCNPGIVKEVGEFVEKLDS